jgi:hypothetical protein
MGFIKTTFFKGEAVSSGWSHFFTARCFTFRKEPATA